MDFVKNQCFEHSRFYYLIVGTVPKSVSGEKEIVRQSVLFTFVNLLLCHILNSVDLFSMSATLWR